MPRQFPPPSDWLNPGSASLTPQFSEPRCFTWSRVCACAWAKVAAALTPMPAIARWIARVIVGAPHLDLLVNRDECRKGALRSSHRLPKVGNVLGQFEDNPRAVGCWGPSGVALVHEPGV